MQTKYAFLFLLLLLGALNVGLAQDIVPLTDSFSTFVGGFTISSDGSTVFHTHSSRNHWSLYARRSGATQPETLAKGEGQAPGLLLLNAANSRLILANVSQIFSFDLISKRIVLLTNRYSAPDFVDRLILDESGKVVFGADAQDRNYYTGYSVVNPYEFPIRYEVEVFDKDGRRVIGIERWIGAFEKHSELLASHLSADQTGGHFVIDAEWPVSVAAVIATASGSSIANLPAQ